MIKEKMETSEKSIHKKIVIQLAMSLLLAGLAARWSIPYALSMRGYFAIGGEYCLIMGMSALPWLFPRRYINVKGNLRLCAMESKCTVSEIVELNDIKNPNNVPIGKELKIPQK